METRKEQVDYPVVLIQAALCLVITLWVGSGGAASSCRLQAGYMAETDFCVTQLVRGLQKAINPSVRECILRWKV